MLSRLKEILSDLAGKVVFGLIAAFEFCVDYFFVIIILLSCGVLALSAVVQYASTPIEKCAKVKKIGGCSDGRCRIETYSGEIMNTRRLVIEEEEYCWESGTMWWRGQ